MSLFPDKDVLTREIETWRGFIEKLPSQDDKAILTKLFDECYKYVIAINSRDHPFHAEPNHLNSTMQSKQTANEFEDE